MGMMTGCEYGRQKSLGKKELSPLSLALNPIFGNTPLALQFLLICLRAPEDLKAVSEVRALTGRGVDWDFFMELVERHGVVSPVYRRLKCFADNNIPKPVLLHLRERYQQNVQQVLVKTSELVRILKRLEQNGISILPLKGPVVSMQAHGDLGSRHVGDLDILVPPDQVLKAEAILLQVGYRRIRPRLSYDSQAEACLPSAPSSLWVRLSKTRHQR